MRALLESGANPNQSLVSYRGEPEFMLHALSQFGVAPGIRLMLEFGAHPDLLQDSDTALDIQSFEQRFTEVCQLPDEYKGRVLPEYPLPTTNECDEYDGPVYQRWLMPQHQRAHAVLRKAGALHAWELKEVPLNETLCLYPDTAGGLFTQVGRPDAAFHARIGSTLRVRIAKWAACYIDPDVAGYDSPEVRRFDYAAALREAQAIGEALAPFIADNVKIATYMPTRDSIAAGCTRGDGYQWNRVTRQWDKASCWEGTPVQS